MTLVNTRLIEEYWQLDPNSPTGLSWIKRKQYVPSSIPGAPACTSKNSGGYYYGMLGGHNYFAHRVVYYLKHGTQPKCVDHLDGVRTHNFPENLREATPSINQHNRIGRGYCWDKKAGKWRAQIEVGGRTKFLGLFVNEQSARAAYLLAKQELHPTAPGRCYDTGIQ